MKRHVGLIAAATLAGGSLRRIGVVDADPEPPAKPEKVEVQQVGPLSRQQTRKAEREAAKNPQRHKRAR